MIWVTKVDAVDRVKAKDINDLQDYKLDYDDPRIADWDAAYSWGDHALAGYSPAVHTHAGGDIVSGTLDGDRLPAMAAAKKGGVPATGAPSGKYLKDDGTWDTPTPPTIGYALAIVAGNLATLTDSATYYFGSKTLPPSTTALRAAMYIPKAGTIKSVELHAYCGTIATDENVSFYVRKNNVSDTKIADTTLDGSEIRINNNALNIAVVVGDYIEIKMVCPAWATNPANVAFGGSIYIE